MANVTLIRMSARLAAIASALACAAATLTAAPAANAAPCADVEVVFARGTGEPPGIGRVGQAFVDALRPQLGSRTLDSYGVNYPADYDFLNSAAGAADASDYVSSLVSQCPSTRIVLGGYSQGAAVMDLLAGIPPLGNKLGGDIAPPLPANLNGSIAAVAVFGNPSTKFSVPITTSIFGGRAIDLCKDGDPICSRGRNPFAHSDYVTAGMPVDAANFVAGLV